MKTLNFVEYNASCPNLDDLKNKKIVELSKRLKGKSKKETLSNILEWEDRNLIFWSERWPLPNLIIYIFVGILLALIFLLILKMMPTIALQTTSGNVIFNLVNAALFILPISFVTSLIFMSVKMNTDRIP